MNAKNRVVDVASMCLEHMHAVEPAWENLGKVTRAGRGIYSRHSKRIKLTKGEDIPI